MTQLDLRQIEKITLSIIDRIMADRSIPARKLEANGGLALTDAEISYLKGVTSAIQPQINGKFNQSDFISSPDSLQWQSLQYAVSAKAIYDRINQVVSENITGAVSIYLWSEFFGTPPNMPLTEISKGDMIIFDSGTQPSWDTLEAGDIVFARTSNPSISNANDWVVAQANLTGAVVSSIPNSVNESIVLFSGTSGRIIKQLTGTGIVTVDNGIVVLKNDAAVNVVRKSFEGNGSMRAFLFFTSSNYSDEYNFSEMVSINGQVLTSGIGKDYTILKLNSLGVAEYLIQFELDWFTPTTKDRIEILAFPKKLEA